jgi:hypothetical protein
MNRARMQENGMIDYAERIMQANRELYMSDNRGVYIPRDFAQSIRRELVSGVDFDDLDTLAGADPYECESYWDIWSDILDSIQITDDDGRIWSLYQDGDLWLVDYAGMAEFEDNTGQNIWEVLGEY